MDKVTCCDYWIFYINLSLNQYTAWHISRWPLRKCFISWSENEVSEISIILHQITIYSPLQARALHQHTHNRFTSPSNLCSLADSRPLFVPCPLSWGVRSLCCYFCTARSVAGQDRGWTQDRQTREGDKGLEWWGGHLLWQVWRAGSIRSCFFFLENANTLSISFVQSFISFTYSFISHIAGGQNFWWPVSASFHQRYYNQLSRDYKRNKPPAFLSTKVGFFFLEILKFWNLFLIISSHIQLSALWVKQPYFRP